MGYPALDIGYMMINMGRKMRNEHFDNFLLKYYSLIVASPKVNSSQFTLAKFKKDCIAYGTSRWCFIFTLLTVFSVPNPELLAVACNSLEEFLEDYPEAVAKGYPFSFLMRTYVTPTQNPTY